jgi:hypothetical protein
LVNDVAVFTQVRAHCLRPAGQVDWQAPPEQTWLAAQAAAHDPQ